MVALKSPNVIILLTFSRVLGVERVADHFQIPVRKKTQHLG